ncbi:hypothetical protein ACLK17_08810 [Escherichia coli]
MSLLGHLSEMSQGAGVQARIDYDAEMQNCRGLKSTFSWRSAWRHRRNFAGFRSSDG